MGSLIETRRRILLDTPHLETASGSVVSFHTDMKSKLKECKLYFSPVQSGSGDPSPDNVRPISGWNGITATHCGKNILDFESLLQYWGSLYTKTGDDDSYFIRGTGAGFRAPFEFFDDDTIVSMNGSVTDSENAVRWRFELLNKNKTEVGRLGATSGNSSGMYQVPNVSANKYRLNYVTAGKGATFENIQVELGTECTSYEPYVGQEIPISWSDLGTKYGGYVDLITGELVVTHGTYSYTKDSTFEYRNKGTFVIATISGMLRGDFYTDENVVCDRAVKVNNMGDVGNSVLGIKIGANSNSIYLYHSVGVTGATTEADFRNWLADNPITVTYPLATPQIYQLTPHTIKTLIGRNNIWSDAGNVEVKFWTH